MPNVSIELPFSGARLRELRVMGGLNQQELANRCKKSGHKVSRAQISKWETARHKPSPAALKAVAKALRVKVGDLLDREVPAP